jgi:hypothetical protein
VDQHEHLVIVSKRADYTSLRMFRDARAADPATNRPIDSRRIPKHVEYNRATAGRRTAAGLRTASSPTEDSRLNDPGGRRPQTAAYGPITLTWDPTIMND